MNVVIISEESNMTRYEEIEIEGKRMLSVEVLNRIRKGEDMLGIEQANLDAMSADELAAYLKDLRRRYLGFKPETERMLASLTEEERLDFKERAAIMEYDGGLSREEAGSTALEMLLNRKE